MGGNGHVGGLAFERGVDDARVDALELIDVRHPLARLAQLLLRAEIGPDRVIELQIAAAGVVEPLHRLLVGLAQIVKEAVQIGIEILCDAVLGETEMQHRRRRNGHLRQDAGVGLEKLEVLQHRMVGEADLADDAQALRLGLHAAELDALVAFVEIDAVEHAEEIEVPPGPPELAVGRELEADLLLLLDDLLDLTVLDGLELGCRDRALLALGPRLLERGGTQEAADMVGTKRRFGSLHCNGSLGQSSASKGTAAKPSSTTKQRRPAPPRRGTGPT